MDNSDNKKLYKNIAIISIIGCIFTCCINVFINNFNYGSNIVKLKKNLNDYKDEETISKNDIVDVNIYQAFIWSICPTICTVFIFSLLIYFIIARSTTKDNVVISSSDLQ
jgi:hypothetical protein